VADPVIQLQLQIGRRILVAERAQRVLRHLGKIDLASGFES